MADLDELTVGDTMTDIVMDIVNADGTAKDISGMTVRLFLEGNTSDDRPASAGNRITSSSLTTVIGSDQLTRAAGSFTGEGWTVGMLIIADGVPEGSYAKAVAAGAVTMSEKATVAHTADLTAVAWFGITCQVTAGPTGEATAVAPGQYLALGGLASDTYEGKARLVDGSNAEVGWTNSARGVVKFRAVQP